MTKAQKSLDIFKDMIEVLDIEIEALRSIRENLSEKFVLAVEMIADCKGQVFVTGVGKSGIIAQKIAATFRSTGTPAIFLHAGEALHGDLGLMRKQDLVLAIGKSGETSEINALLRVLRKSGIPIISMTASPASSMARLSDLVLELKIPREACPLNLAPTASTTAAVAVGDAMAVVLMKMKNISPYDFARHHPGGQLGKRLLLTVGDVMRKGDQNPVILVDRSIREMLVQITAFHVGAISVVDDGGRLVGLVTDFDVRKVLESEENIFAMKISDAMNPSPAVILVGEKAVTALEMMRERDKPIAVLPVLDEESRVVGMVHLHDLISAGL